MSSLFVTQYLSRASSLPSPGAEDVRWLRPVRPGQRLTLRTTVEQTRPSRSKPDRGLVSTRLEMVDSSGEVACSMVVVNLIRNRPSS